MKEEIERIARSEAEDKVAEAEARAKQIIAEAKREAEGIQKRILEEARTEAQKQKVRQVSRKKLGVKMDYLETRESVIDEIMVEARSQLQKYTKSKEYPGFLEKLVKSSAVSIGGGDLVLQLRKEDKSHFTKDSLGSLAKEVGKVSGVETSISVSDKNLNALGGIYLSRADNKVFVDNTFERRIERSSEGTRVALLEWLS